MKTLKARAVFVLSALLWMAINQAAFSADRFESLCQEAPVIVRAKILKLERGTAISDDSLEFQVEAEVFDVAKGNLKQSERIAIVIKLQVRDSALLRDNPFGMKRGSDFILFLQPHFAADRKTLIHYRFTETPLGCLPHNFYTWKRIEGAIE